MIALTCVLCDQTDYQVKVALVEWREPVEDQRFSAVARCTDRVACRRRVEEQGAVWEVVEATA